LSSECVLRGFGAGQIYNIQLLHAIRRARRCLLSWLKFIDARIIKLMKCRYNHQAYKISKHFRLCVTIPIGIAKQSVYLNSQYNYALRDCFAEPRKRVGKINFVLKRASLRTDSYRYCEAVCIPTFRDLKSRTAIKGFIIHKQAKANILVYKTPI
jgi:hypothetical protein